MRQMSTNDTRTSGEYCVAFRPIMCMAFYFQTPGFGSKEFIGVLGGPLVLRSVLRWHARLVISHRRNSTFHSQNIRHTLLPGRDLCALALLRKTTQPLLLRSRIRCGPGCWIIKEHTFSEIRSVEASRTLVEMRGSIHVAYQSLAAEW